MRVVGGTLRGRRLSSFKGLSIRPTSDKVREAVFNILAPPGVLPGGFRKTLDLFAGTGAMAIEALSRGVGAAVLVDKDPKSTAVIRKNLELCGLSDRARVLRMDAQDAIRRLSRQDERFDLIFVDPPYDSTLTLDALTGIEKEGLLGPGGVLVVETSKRAGLSFQPVSLRQIDSRRYGDTLIYLFTAEAPGEGPEHGS